MTDNLPRRIYEHKLKIRPCFTNMYNADKLIYFEEHKNLQDAAAREIHIKGWTRKKKIDLINSINPKWIDLTLEISERL
jgi:putative endonuclease